MSCAGHTLPDYPQGADRCRYGRYPGAATTSLPEISGGEANWDYRYTWLRDASFVLHALLDSGYREEAEAWRSWLLRAVAGGPESLQPMYGIGGERRLVEHELPWLSGFNGATPVRIGNGAWQQQQLDVYGEVMDALHRARRHALAPESDLWHVQYQLLEYLEQHWQEPGAGLWELRGPQRHYTHSRVMVWVAFDRAVKAVECFDMKGDLERWKALRQQVHDEVCAHGFNERRQSFVQYYGGEALDVSALLLPLMGFLPADDPRMVSTVDLIRKELGHDDFLYRFLTDNKQTCLTDGEGAFVIGCFWLVDNLVLQERYDEARALFDQLLGIRNDLGLMSEEYDPRSGRQLGNVPQAFSHVGLINSAHLLTRGTGSSKGYP
ncbi:glycoside hydrolase family 15 protein [Kushneria konosiri]|uniref:glycoside hydrolase family 15 protein n=1 Tax=Kushneria konosiri TaxID=698828 RepID=UPI001D131CAA